MSRPCIIMDIDGTLSNAEHRVHLLGGRTNSAIDQAPDWEAFLAAAADDTVNEEIKLLNNAMSAHVPVFICTGRKDDQLEMTSAWLKKFGITYNFLLMRDRRDRRPDTEIKKEMLDQIRETGFEPLFAVEDRKSVTAMWRENGVRCLQVCEGDY
ncbi:HAD superfamily, subfamily IIIB (Acid phosphatase) [Faunimonas pinastri]|uniref:HAD superfamily, subfamily IIIB (Acid phosphatase) n=1 Tax=Faunimonas pinastri TaxID=1855383 RepID=A0A1H9MRW3_9HYPH|nr:HAD family acid phosphatase [Faunimonas pinastri]SER26378.1 HAD superfamily, subfamily IIIB (Acid phosphatase) [Faunimonas pinastri]